MPIIKATKLSAQGLCIAVLAASGTLASADIVNDLFVIDAFENSFESESFVSSYSNGTANSLRISSGLEVGQLLLGSGYEAGDVHPGFTARSQEIQYQTGLESVLGGVRSSELTAGSALGSPVRVYSNRGGLSFNTAFGTQAKLGLRYDGGGQLNQDFSSIAGGAFQIELVAGDMYYPQYGIERPVPIELVLTSGLGTDYEKTFGVGSTLLESGVNHVFDFGDFTGIDFSDIDVIALSIDQSGSGLQAVDFQLGSFGVLGTLDVPAPGVLALLSTAGLVGLRRRR